MPIAQLFLIFYGIFALVTPALVVYALIRHNRLRADVESLSEENRKRTSEYERQIARLTARLHALESSRPAQQTALSSETKPSVSPAYADKSPLPVTVSHDELALLAKETPAVPPTVREAEKAASARACWAS